MQRVRAFTLRAPFAALLACGLLAPLAIHWVAGRTLVWFDTMLLYAPQRWLVDEALRSLRLPLWNPFSGAGMPFLADAIHGVLHPVSVLTAWLGTERSVDVLIGGHVLCAGLGAGLLARDLGCSRPGAAAAGFAYGTSGFVLSMAGNLVFLAGAGSLPLCAAGLRRFAVEPRPASLALGVAGAAVLGLSGDAQALMVGGAVAAALAWEGAGWRGVARATAAGALGLLVAGAQLLPSAVHLPRTVRATELWSPSPLAWAFEPWRLPELLLPGFYRGADPLEDPLFVAIAGPGRWPAAGVPVPFAASVFVGLVPAVLALAGAREGRRGRLLAAVALALLWSSLGSRLGASALLAHVPVWSTFRHAEKLVGPLTLVVALLAGLGLDAIVARRVSGRAVAGTTLALALGSLLALRLLSTGLAPDLAALASARLARGAWHVLGAAAALAAWWLARDRLGEQASGAALAGLAWAGMAAAAPLALRPGAPEARLFAPGPAIAAAAPGARIVDVTGQAAFDEGPDLLDEVGRAFAARGVPAFNVRARLDSLSHGEGAAPARLALLDTHFQGRWPIAAGRYAATHLLVDPRVVRRGSKVYAAVTAGGTLEPSGTGAHETWAVPHRPWASFAPEVRIAGDPRSAAVELLRALGDRSDAAVVEGTGPFATAPGRVLSVERALESVRIEAEAEGDATLVIADAWWPGWEATLDGRAAPILPADVLVRAVRWPAGRHVLELRYRPPEVRAGILLSALGLLATAAWIAFLRRAAAGQGPVP